MSLALENELVVLMPVYNDWNALSLLLPDLERSLASSELKARIVLVDDGSTATAPVTLGQNHLKSIISVDVVSLRRNLGHQRAIAAGLSYIEANLPQSMVVVMDSDGEDSPQDVPRLVRECLAHRGEKIVFAARTRRSEGWFFTFCYHILSSHSFSLDRNPRARWKLQRHSTPTLEAAGGGVRALEPLRCRRPQGQASSDVSSDGAKQSIGRTNAHGRGLSRGAWVERNGRVWRSHWSSTSDRRGARNGFNRYRLGRCICDSSHNRSRHSRLGYISDWTSTYHIAANALSDPGVRFRNSFGAQQCQYRYLLATTPTSLVAACEFMADGHIQAYVGGELDLFALAKNWKTYVRTQIADYIRGDVLEVGAGIGGTTVALHDGTARHWVCLEPDATLAARLLERLSAYTGLIHDKYCRRIAKCVRGLPLF